MRHKMISTKAKSSFGQNLNLVAITISTEFIFFLHVIEVDTNEHCLLYFSLAPQLSLIVIKLFNKKAENTYKYHQQPETQKSYT